MAPKALPSAEVLRQLLRYEPETGKLFWRERGVESFPSPRMCKTWNTRYSNTEAFTTADRAGYLTGKVFDRFFFAHRVIWAIQTGCWPVQLVDHINGVTSDNSWANLRAADPSQNCCNARRRVTNKSGVKGVSLHKETGRWVARVNVKGKVHSLGCFATIDLAAQAYAKACKDLHGEFGRLS